MRNGQIRRSRKPWAGGGGLRIIGDWALEALYRAHHKASMMTVGTPGTCGRSTAGTIPATRITRPWLNRDRTTQTRPACARRCGQPERRTVVLRASVGSTEASNGRLAHVGRIDRSNIGSARFGVVGPKRTELRSANARESRLAASPFPSQQNWAAVAGTPGPGPSAPRCGRGGRALKVCTVNHV